MNDHCQFYISFLVLPPKYFMVTSILMRLKIDQEFGSSLTTFQAKFWEFRHNFDIQVAKSTKELRSQDGDSLARSSTQLTPSQAINSTTNNSSGTNIPTAPPAPSFKSIDQKTGKLSVTPFSGINLI